MMSTSSWFWIELPNEVSRSRFFPCCAQYQSNVYVFGGANKLNTQDGDSPSRKSLNDLFVYNASTDTMRILHPGSTSRGPQNAGKCPGNRKGASLCVSPDGERLFLFGGTGSSCLNDLWEFDLKSKKWTDLSAISLQKTGEAIKDDSVAKYPAVRGYHSAIMKDSTMIIFGGFGTEVEDSLLWKYDVDTMVWQQLPMKGVPPIDTATPPCHPGVRFGHTTCVYENTMYIFGGQIKKPGLPPKWTLAENSIWGMSLDNYTWFQKKGADKKDAAVPSSGPCRRTYAASTLLGSRWWIHGGSGDNREVFNDIYEFDFSVSEWTSLAHLLTPTTVEGHCAAALMLDDPTSCEGCSTVNGDDSEMTCGAFLLVGGASSKTPGSFVGSILRCDFVLPGKYHPGLKFSNFVVRPASAAAYMARLRAALHHSSSSLETKNQISTLMFEEQKQKYQEMLARYEDVKLQLDTVHENAQILNANGGVTCPNCQKIKTTADEKLASVTEKLKSQNSTLKDELMQSKGKRQDLAVRFNSLLVEKKDVKKALANLETTTTKNEKLVSKCLALLTQILETMTNEEDTPSSKTTKDIKSKLNTITSHLTKIHESNVEVNSIIELRKGAIATKDFTDVQILSQIPPTTTTAENTTTTVMEQTTVEVTTEEQQQTITTTKSTTGAVLSTASTPTGGENENDRITNHMKRQLSKERQKHEQKMAAKEQKQPVSEQQPVYPVPQEVVTTTTTKLKKKSTAVDTAAQTNKNEEKLPSPKGVDIAVQASTAATKTSKPKSPKGLDYTFSAKASLTPLTKRESPNGCDYKMQCGNGNLVLVANKSPVSSSIAGEPTAVRA